MLVLGRHIDESVVLVLPDGRRATIFVTGIDCPTGRTLVRLGFDAPQDVVIVRPDAMRKSAARLAGKE